MPRIKDGAGTLSFLQADGLGSIAKTTNSTGTVTATRRYDSFGNLEVGATSGYAFTGREWDAETGLAYYRARYYDATLGIFISEDPIGPLESSNPYAYAGGNPINCIDPKGEDWIDDTILSGRTVFGRIRRCAPIGIR